MRKYEFMMIMDPGIDPSDAKKRDAILAKLLGDQTYKVAEVTDMGKKRLRYDIEKKVEGVYVLFILESESLRAGEIEKQKRLTPEVLRYLLTQQGA